MGDDQETITVAEYSDGPPTGEQPDRSVDLPVVEILTGRGFITGKSGSGKSNTASVVAEKLLDSGFGILIVDIDGEYYGLKEEYEILHVGGDEECDIQVTVEHAGKIASLALEQNVPIILDVSSFLDEEEAEELLTEVSKQLFAKEKKLKQPFLMLVEEVHEWIPEKGSVSECGKMLIKIGKRGRKHGLGMVGISQRPADVKKDFITQCDWLVWHRLTWNNDTKVVSRILDTEYANAIEDLGDGEGFMMTDWSETVRRVQFHRKKTFDAGATPGLDDVDRPDLKSVSSDLVSELESISEEKQQTEDRIAELREELDRKNSRIAELETELQDARDMSRMADQFVDALIDTVGGVNPGRTEQEKMRDRRQRNDRRSEDRPPASGSTDATAESQDAETDVAESNEESTDTPAAADVAIPNPDLAVPSDDTDSQSDEATQAASGNDPDRPADDSEQSPTDPAGPVNGPMGPTDDPAGPADDPPEPADDPAHSATDPGQSVEDGGDVLTDPANTTSNPADATSGATAGMTGAVLDGTAAETVADGDGSTNGSGDEQSDDADVAAAIETVADDGETASEQETESPSGDEFDAEDRELIEQLRSAIDAMKPRTRGMLRYYRDQGPDKPIDAFFAAGGDDDRTKSYAHNRTLRTQGFIEHVGRGHYDYRIEDLVEEEYRGRTDDETRDAIVEAVESAFEP